MRRGTVTGLHMIAAEILHKHPKSTKIEAITQNEVSGPSTDLTGLEVKYLFFIQLKKKKKLPFGEVGVFYYYITLFSFKTSVVSVNKDFLFCGS